MAARTAAGWRSLALSLSLSASRGGTAAGGRNSVARGRRMLSGATGGAAPAAPAPPAGPPPPPLPPPLPPAGAVEPTGNIILDNPGWIMAAAIGGFAGWLYYGKRRNDAKTALVEAIEAEAVISPYEIKQMRENNDLTPARFEQLLRDVKQRTGDQPLNMHDAAAVLLKHLPRKDHISFLAYGHHLERVMMTLERFETNLALDPRLVLTTLSMAMSGTPDERLNIMFQVFADLDQQVVRKEALEKCVEFHAATFQLPPDSQVWMTQKYPLAKFERMTAAEMVDSAMGSEQVETRDAVSLEDFKKVMVNKHVCVWGECHNAGPADDKKKKKKSPEGTDSGNGGSSSGGGNVDKHRQHQKEQEAAEEKAIERAIVNNK